jgi:hypothetical protein
MVAPSFIDSRSRSGGLKVGAGGLRTSKVDQIEKKNIKILGALYARPSMVPPGA